MKLHLYVKTNLNLVEMCLIIMI